MKNTKNIFIITGLIALVVTVGGVTIFKMSSGNNFLFSNSKSQSDSTESKTRVIDVGADYKKRTDKSAGAGRQKDTPTNKPQPKTEDTDGVLDSEKRTNATYSINLSLSGARSISDKGRPQANAASWEYFTNKIENNRKANGVTGKDSFVDPHTNTVYKFTENEPGFGEIQYRTDKSCNKTSHDFLAPRIRDNFAYRLRFKKTGVECFTNF